MTVPQTWPGNTTHYRNTYRLFGLMPNSCTAMHIDLPWVSKRNVRISYLHLIYLDLWRLFVHFFEVYPNGGCLLSKKKMPAAAYTRWLTRGKCLKFEHYHRKEIIKILDELFDTADDSTTRYEAIGILRKIKTHQNMFLLNVFQDIYVPIWYIRDWTIIHRAASKRQRKEHVALFFL